jgi:hypothetical protein
MRCGMNAAHQQAILTRTERMLRSVVEGGQGRHQNPSPFVSLRLTQHFKIPSPNIDLSDTFIWEACFH